MIDVAVTVLLTEETDVEDKEDQWMGVTVQSQGPGGKIVVSVTHSLCVSPPHILDPSEGLLSLCPSDVRPPLPETLVYEDASRVTRHHGPLLRPEPEPHHQRGRRGRRRQLELLRRTRPRPREVRLLPARRSRHLHQRLPLRAVRSAWNL